MFGEGGMHALLYHCVLLNDHEIPDNVNITVIKIHGLYLVVEVELIGTWRLVKFAL